MTNKFLNNVYNALLTTPAVGENTKAFVTLLNRIEATRVEDEIYMYIYFIDLVKPSFDFKPRASEL